MARLAKLGKKIEGTDVTFSVLTDEGEVFEELTFNFGDLPVAIQSYLGPFGLGHKLGDSAASAATPEDRVEAINRTWSALAAGEWTIRQPASPKEKTPRISKKAVAENFATLSAEEQEVARGILEKLGFKF
jgi:hypothetical protein